MELKHIFDWEKLYKENKRKFFGFLLLALALIALTSYLIGYGGELGRQNASLSFHKDQLELSKKISVSQENYGDDSVQIGVNLGTISIDKGEENEDKFKRFYDASQLGVCGMEVCGGVLINGGTDLYKKLKGLITLRKDGTTAYSCKEGDIQRYDLIINKYPNFPFTYFARGLCRLRYEDPVWLEDILKVREILNMTTSFDGHHINHDEFLDMLNTFKIIDNADKFKKQLFNKD